MWIDRWQELQIAFKPTRRATRRSSSYLQTSWHSSFVLSAPQISHRPPALSRTDRRNTSQRLRGNRRDRLFAWSGRGTISIVNEGAAVTVGQRSYATDRTAGTDPGGGCSVGTRIRTGSARCPVGLTDPLMRGTQAAETASCDAPASKHKMESGHLDSVHDVAARRYLGHVPRCRDVAARRVMRSRDPHRPCDPVRTGRAAGVRRRGRLLFSPCGP